MKRIDSTLDWAADTLQDSGTVVKGVLRTTAAVVQGTRAETCLEVHEDLRKLGLHKDAKPSTLENLKVWEKKLLEW